MLLCFIKVLNHIELSTQLMLLIMNNYSSELPNTDKLGDPSKLKGKDLLKYNNAKIKSGFYDKARQLIQEALVLKLKEIFLRLDQIAHPITTIILFPLNLMSWVVLLIISLCFRKYRSRIE